MKHCTPCALDLPDAAAFCPDCGGAVGDPADGPALATLGGLDTLAPSTGTTRRGADACALELGARFADRYVIGERLGAGGMGAVHRAHDETTGREVALKVVRPERGDVEAELDRLVAEGVTARDIRHPNVVAVYDVGRAGGQAYLSMEAVRGTTLRAWMRERAAAREDVPVDVALAIVRAIGEGVGAAHARGVVHRDLKPENVILTAEPTAEGAALKVLDFGLATAALGSRGSGSGRTAGTPHYMAPEQVTHADLVTPAADVYSLSVILYELLVGTVPQGHWQPPSGGRSDVPRALDALVERGLSNRPNARPASVEEFLGALEETPGADVHDLGRRALEGVNGLAGRWRENAERRREELRKDPRKRLLAWAGLAVIVVLALVSEFAGGTAEDAGFASLSGTWRDVAGHTFDVDVAPDGSFQGSGRMQAGNGAFLVGAVDGRTVEGRMDVDGMPYASFHGAWDGARRFEVSLVTPDGYPMAETAFVVGR